MGVRPGTLRRWLRQGCPTVTRGRRGRGNAALVDPEAVRQWRGAGERERVFLELADAIPEVLAGAAAESLRLAQGMDKKRLAGVLTAHWYLGTAAVLDRMREQCPSVPDLTAIPDAVERLQKIERR